MITLKEAKQKDMNNIYKIQKLAFKNLFEKYQDQDSPFNEKESSLIEKFNRPNNYFLLIKEESIVIGYIRIITNETGTAASLSQIALNPKYDGLGYGTKAMNLLEKEYPKIMNWSLGTILQEEKLIHFYSKLNYKETGDIVNIQENMDIIFFLKKRVDC